MMENVEEVADSRVENETLEVQKAVILSKYSKRQEFVVRQQTPSCRRLLTVVSLSALRDSISVYIGPSPKEREKEERNDRQEKNDPTTTTRTYCKQLALALL